MSSSQVSFVHFEDKRQLSCSAIVNAPQIHVIGRCRGFQDMSSIRPFCVQLIGSRAWTLLQSALVPEALALSEKVFAG